MRRKYFITSIIIIIACICIADDVPYDLYIPEPYEIPMSNKLFTPHYMYIEAGLSSHSDLLLYGDYIQRNMNLNAHFIINTVRGRFGTVHFNGSIPSSTVNYYTDILLKTAQLDSINTRMGMTNALSLCIHSLSFAYMNNFYLMYTDAYQYDVFHSVSGKLHSDDKAIELNADIISLSNFSNNIYRIILSNANTGIGVIVYSLPFPYFTFSSQNISIEANVGRYSRMLIESPFSDHFYEEHTLYLHDYYNIDAIVSAMQMKWMLNARTEIDAIESYSDIDENDIEISAYAEYTNLFDPIYISIKPGYEYSDYYRGIVFNTSLSYKYKYSNIMLQYTLYYDDNVYNNVNLILSSGNSNFRVICGIKNLLETDDPYYEYYSPYRSYFISIAVIGGSVSD